jgi:hypothetical protein
MSVATGGAPGVCDTAGAGGLGARHPVQQDAAAASVSDAISVPTLDRFNVETPTKNKGLAEARPSSYTTGSKLLRT